MENNVDHADHELSRRPTYTRDQLRLYVDRLHRGRNVSYTLEDLEGEIRADPLKALGSLQRKHLAAIPWGNVTLHYSPHRTLSLDSEALFRKLVERGLGGYCMEVNIFFSNVLRSLGYDLYITGGRISNAVEVNGKHPDGFGGWEHTVILATIGGQKYHVDVGFANMGSSAPILLREGETIQCLPGLEGRLARRTIAPAADRSQQLWLFETRNATDQKWVPGYCFSELEFLLEDFVNFNYRTSQDPQSWFTYRLILTKILLDDQMQEVTGTVTMVGSTIARRIAGGKSETLKECATEAARVQAMDDIFGVKLLPEETDAIVGMATQIRPAFNL